MSGAERRNIRILSRWRGARWRADVRVAPLLVAAISGVPNPPFTAWLPSASANVRAEPDKRSSVVGVLQRGDTVRVTGCVPDCTSKDAWALLGDDGAIRLSLLEPGKPPPEAKEQSASARYTWAKAIRTVRVRAEADPKSKVIERIEAGRVLSFVPDEDARKAGFLARPGRGFVALTDVREETPSTFEGVEDPELPLAFAVREIEPTRRDPDRPAFEKHDEIEIVREEKGRIVTPDGEVPRSLVRVAREHERPEEIPPDARWVHVDLEEQVLTAWEGDRVVFATLVSTGKDAEHPTVRGVFRVWLKKVHHTMTGDEDDPYFVENVPFAQFFHSSWAIHGTFWHDAFGRPVSHGCVNVSLADAEWLYEWSPPEVPDGWHGIAPKAAGQDSLWVVVERSSRKEVAAN